VTHTVMFFMVRTPAGRGRTLHQPSIYDCATKGGNNLQLPAVGPEARLSLAVGFVVSHPFGRRGDCAKGWGHPNSMAKSKVGHLAATLLGK
jgi:hypothetical protein